MTNSTSPLPGYTLYDPEDPYENHAGPFYWKELSAGVHHFVMRVTNLHCNRYGIVHGGMLMTLIDLAMVAHAKKEMDDTYVTVSMSNEFVAAGKKGDLLEATGELIRRTKSLAFVRGRIHVEDQTLLTASAVFKAIRA